MLKKYGSLLIVAVLGVFLVFAFESCKPKDNKDGKTDGPAKPEYKSEGKEGTISGIIKFEGTPAAPKKIDMGADPNCAAAGGEKVTEEVVVADGKLANVFLYLTGGPVDQHSFAAPSDPVLLDQKGCRYDPHVLGLMTGQTLKITNSDQAAHNIHPYPKNNTEWNESQPPGAAPKEKKFNRAETLIPVKCNQHPWMKANVGVLGHPCFAVSAKDGSFTIKNVPPGKYTLVAWHETMGEQKVQITVGDNENKTQEFTYKAGVAYAPSSLKVEAALILP
jgi:plastocyanin